MTYFKIVLLLLQISRSIISYLEREKAISEGERRQLARELEALARNAKIAREGQTKVDGMTDDEIDAALRGDFRT